MGQASREHCNKYLWQTQATFSLNKAEGLEYSILAVAAYQIVYGRGRSVLNRVSNALFLFYAMAGIVPTKKLDADNNNRKESSRVMVDLEVQVPILTKNPKHQTVGFLHIN